VTPLLWTLIELHLRLSVWGVSFQSPVFFLSAAICVCLNPPVFALFSPLISSIYRVFVSHAHASSLASPITEKLLIFGNSANTLWPFHCTPRRWPPWRPSFRTFWWLDGFFEAPPFVSPPSWISFYYCRQMSFFFYATFGFSLCNPSPSVRTSPATETGLSPGVPHSPCSA